MVQIDSVFAQIRTSPYESCIRRIAIPASLQESAAKFLHRSGWGLAGRWFLPTAHCPAASAGRRLCRVAQRGQSRGVAAPSTLSPALPPLPGQSQSHPQVLAVTVVSTLLTTTSASHHHHHHHRCLPQLSAPRRRGGPSRLPTAPTRTDGRLSARGRRRPAGAAAAATTWPGGGGGAARRAGLGCQRTTDSRQDDTRRQSSVRSQPPRTGRSAAHTQTGLLLSAARHTAGPALHVPRRPRGWRAGRAITLPLPAPPPLCLAGTRLTSGRNSRRRAAAARPSAGSPVAASRAAGQPRRPVFGPLADEERGTDWARRQRVEIEIERSLVHSSQATLTVSSTWPVYLGLPMQMVADRPSRQHTRLPY